MRISMERIPRKLKINGFKEVIYTVYTKEEADEQGITYKIWRDCDAGEFGISDDGYVADCIARNEYKTGTEMQFSFGKMWANSNNKLLYEPRRESGNYSNVSSRAWEQIEAGKSRTQRAVEVYTRMLLSGCPINWRQIGELYRSDQKYPHLSARRLFKQEEVKRMVDDRIDKALKERGITEGEVLDVIGDAIKIAKKKKDPSSMLRGAETYVKMLDMFPKRSTQTDSVQIDVTNKIMDQIELEEKRLIVEQKKEVSPNGQ